MVQYIYFVKCPNCEDEPFDFFDEAKDFALGRMSKKPIITQIEVNRNDFGECTDSADLGTIWSWEDMMTETDAESACSVFTKDDFKDFESAYNPENDPEFTDIDNSVDFEPEETSALDEVPDNFRKPIPEGMTIEELVEEMEENEDTVECTWCNDLFDKSECRKEVNLGWLCSRCEAAIKSRGETLTFRENSYWDFLDEEVSLTEATADYAYPYLAELPDAKVQVLEAMKLELPEHYFKGDTFDAVANYPKLHITSKVLDFVFVGNRVQIKCLNNRNNQTYYEDLEDVFDGISRGCSGYEVLKTLRDVAKHLNKTNTPKITARRDANVFGMLTPELAEEFKQHIKKIEYQIPLLDLYAEDFIEDKYQEPLTDAAQKKLEAIYNSFLSLDFARNALDAGIVKNRPSQLDSNHNIEKSWRAEGKITFDCPVSSLSSKAQEVINAAKVGTTEPTSNTSLKTIDCYRLANALIRYFDGDIAFFNTRELLTASLDHEELEEAADYRARLTLCPECGTDSFDQETGICINCGFNI